MIQWRSSRILCTPRYLLDATMHLHEVRVRSYVRPSLHLHSTVFFPNLAQILLPRLFSIGSIFHSALFTIQLPTLISLSSIVTSNQRSVQFSSLSSLDKGSVKKKVFLDLGHIDKCGFLHGVQHVSNITI